MWNLVFSFSRTSSRGARWRSRRVFWTKLHEQRTGGTALHLAMIPDWEKHHHRDQHHRIVKPPNECVKTLMNARDERAFITVLTYISGFFMYEHKHLMILGTTTGQHHLLVGKLYRLDPQYFWNYGEPFVEWNFWSRNLNWTPLIF